MKNAANACSWTPLSHDELCALDMTDELGGYATEQEQYVYATGNTALLKMLGYVQNPAPPVTVPVRHVTRTSSSGKAHPWDTRFREMLTGRTMSKSALVSACRSYSIMQDKYLGIEIYRALKRGIIQRSGDMYKLA